MNRSVYIMVSGVCKYVSRNNGNIRSETLFCKNSYDIVTNELIHNANELAGIHITQDFTKKCF